MVKNLKIDLEGGIGDTIKTLSFGLRSQYLYDTYGIKTHFSYSLDSRRNYCGWGLVLRNTFAYRNPAFEYVTNKKNFDAIDALEIERPLDIRKILNIETPSFSPIRTPLEKGEEPIKLSAERVNIGVQLQGNDSKKVWGRTPEESYNRWKVLFKRIRNSFPNVLFHIMDDPRRSSISELFKEQGIVSTIGINLAQALDLISRLDILIAPDSYSKYISHWYDTTQITLMTQLPYVDPDTMIMNCFPRMTTRKGLILLGIDFEDGSVTRIVKHVREISEDEIFTAVSKQIEALC